MQGVDVAVYIHPCVLYSRQDVCSMLAGSELTLRPPVRGLVVVDDVLVV